MRIIGTHWHDPVAELPAGVYLVKAQDKALAMTEPQSKAFVYEDTVDVYVQRVAYRTATGITLEYRQHEPAMSRIEAWRLWIVWEAATILKTEVTLDVNTRRW